MTNNPKLSIVILSYNTKELLMLCLDSLVKLKDEVLFEVIVSDNGSGDGSPDMIEGKYPWVTLIRGKKNLGFAAGNNKAKRLAKGKFILFLNTDTEVPANTLKETLNYLENNSLIGALTCKIILPNGELDRDARRSFPTPWVSLTHFTGLDRIFPKSKLFARYWYGYKSSEVAHEVDVLQGAFFMVRKKILDEIGWFDEDYFLDGEDIDLCWKIKKNGWKIYYYPKVSITHLKGATKGKVHHSYFRVTRQERIRYINSGVDSMKIFYDKRMKGNYPLFINLAVTTGIKLLKFIRYLKALLS